MLVTVLVALFGGISLFYLWRNVSSPLAMVPPDYDIDPAPLLAPYVAAGITGSPIAGTPWTRSNVIRVTTALALEWLGVFRLEMGYGVQSRRLHYAFGVTRDFWSVL